MIALKPYDKSSYGLRSQTFQELKINFLVIKVNLIVDIFTCKKNSMHLKLVHLCLAQSRNSITKVIQFFGK